MIYDHIKNIGLYKRLTPALDLALEYIETVTPDVEVGSHPLELGVKAVVSEGTTGLVNPKGYEAIGSMPMSSSRSSARNSSVASRSRR